MTSNEYRCPDDDDTTPTMAAIIADFMKQASQSGNAARNEEWLLESFADNCDRNCYGGNCDCDDLSEGEYHPYMESHGIDNFMLGLAHFFGDYCIDKLSPSAEDFRECCATFRSLIQFLTAKGHVTAKDSRQMMNMVETASAIDADGLRESVNRLMHEGYWDFLEKEEQDGDSDGSDASDSSVSAYSELDTNADENLVVKEIRPDGWLMYRSMVGIDLDSDIDSEDDGDGYYMDMIRMNAEPPKETMFLRLHPDVAAKGVRKMYLSCMGLARRGGIWRPYPVYDSSPFANVYPPL